MDGKDFETGTEPVRKEAVSGGVSVSTIPKNTSRRITSLRFLLIVLVVFIHNNFTDSSNMVDVFSQGLFGKWTQRLISGGIAECAVPLFFMFAAYIQERKADSYGTLLRKKARSLLAPYLIWIGINGFYYAGLKLILLKIAPGIIKNPDTTALSWPAEQWFYGIVGYAPGYTHPRFAPQFWFIRDLMILTALSPILRLFARRFPAAFLAGISMVLFTPLNVHFVAGQALFFYGVGMLAAYHNVPFFEKTDRITWPETALFFLGTFILRYVFYEGNSVIHCLMVISACVVLLKFSALIVSNDRLYSAAAYLAGFSFFLFAIHSPRLQKTLQMAWIHFFPMKNGFFCLFEYFGVSALTIVIGTAAGIGLKKICPPLFRLLNGGR